MRNAFHIVFLFTTLTFSINAQNPLGFSIADGKNSFELSFKEESNLIILPIMINGNGPFNFILDTGSESGMIFEKSILKDYNLDEARRIPIYSDDGIKITDLLVANSLEIQMPGIQAINQSMLVLQNNDLDVRNILGVDAHGVLGSELFNRFVVEIDYANEKIRFYEPSTFTSTKRFKKLDIEVKNFRPYINTTIKQKGQKKLDLTLLIDTGASSALFLDQEKHESIKLPETNLNHTLGSSLTGVLEGKLARVKKIKIGKYKFKNVLTSFPENWQIQKVVKDQDGAITRYGTLGSDILSRFTVIYDYMSKSIYLKKNGEFKEGFKFNRAGFTFRAAGKALNQYYVSTIIPNSPAEEIDLQVNDEIISIAGKPVFFYSFSELNGLLRESQGNILTLIIRRKGELLRKELRLKKLI